MADSVDPKDLYVGQPVWVEYTLNARGQTRLQETKIVKIGKKWIDTDNRKERFSCEKLWLDGGQYSSPGRVWFSPEDWETSKETNLLWDKLRRRFPYNAESHITPDTVRQIWKLVYGEDMPEESKNG